MTAATRTSPSTPPICTAGWAKQCRSAYASRSRAAALVRQGIPAVCVVPSDAPAVFRHQGVRFVACPASRGGRKVQCISCCGRFGLPLCAQADRGFVITFPAHGARAAAAAAHCS